MKRKIINLGTCVFILLVPVSSAFSQNHDQVESIISNAISQAGGAEAWNDGTLKVNEVQKRYEEGGVVIVNLMHTMNTDGSGYLIELSREGKTYDYGWDGNEFWAKVDDRPGNDDEVLEARRIISDAYFRFSLPFVLEKDIHELEYAGTDSLFGMKTEVLNITYEEGPADRYFSGQVTEHGEHSGQAISHQGSDEGHASGSELEAQSGHTGGHGHGGEDYFFHFTESGQLVKVYFSHHGDGTYETLHYKNIKLIGGIAREHMRTLLRSDGDIHYESFFSKIEFTNRLDAGAFKKL